jgi:hypothetical protein
MSPLDVVALRERLSDRDIAILETLRAHRMASTDQLRRLHFTEPFGSVAAATRATTRVLGRLEGHSLIARLERRIGGVRKGSTSLIWQLASTGDRLLAIHHGEAKRRRYIEPRTAAFTAHTIAVTELAVRLREAVREGQLDQVGIETEPSCWRSFLGAHGQRETLKPDLHVVTAAGEFEDHWFFEADLASEHPPVVARKAQIYQRYAETGAHQDKHGVFPITVWIVPTLARKHALERALRAGKGLTPGLFRVATTDEFLTAVLAGGDQPAGP